MIKLLEAAHLPSQQIKEFHTLIACLVRKTQHMRLSRKYLQISRRPSDGSVPLRINSRQVFGPLGKHSH